MCIMMLIAVYQEGHCRALIAFTSLKNVYLLFGYFTSSLAKLNAVLVKSAFSQCN